VIIVNILCYKNMELPKVKIPAEHKDPKYLIMFGLPKVGKTTIVAQLPKCLIVDLEKGSTYVEAYKVKASNYVELFEIAKALRANPGQYNFVALDTVTALEDIALPYANKLYRNTPMGVNFDPKENILKLPNGAGYLYFRQAMEEIIGWFTNAVQNVILIGHVKEKSLNEKGTEMNVIDLDVTGKMGRILSSLSDAICYVYRDPETNELYANFGASASVLSGSRLDNLSGQTILLSKKEKDGTIKTYWENIYSSLKDNKKE